MISFNIFITFLLALLNFGIISWVFLHYRPFLNLVHLSAVSIFFNFTARPILSAINDYSLLYISPLDVEERASMMNQAMLIGLFATIIFYIGYYLVMRKIRYKRKEPVMHCRYHHMLSIVGASALLVSVIVLYHILTSGQWLPGARTVAITTLIPGGKYFFGLSIVLATIIPLIGYIIWSKVGLFGKIIIIISSLTAVISLFLLYQRGFFLMLFILVLWFFEKKTELRLKHLIILFLFGIIVITFMRPLAFGISRGTIDLDLFSLKRLNPTTLFLKSPNFASLDSSVVMLEYIDEEGYTFGKTFLSWPFRILPLKTRVDITRSASDILNEFVYKEHYREKGYGFAVGITHELYLAFGWIGIILMLIPGIITGYIDRWLSRVNKITIITPWLVGAAFATGGFAGEVAAQFQWALLYFVVGVLITFFCSVLLSPSIRVYKLKQ
ncbi:hypothetical protein AMJ49_04215 [Parcubacteria bacterium DG_74_2]|nr:MAG: hypothetical protein AMJ49_04215 [Parcubacteria bacterium DG_74_2]